VLEKGKQYPEINVFGNHGSVVNHIITSLAYKLVSVGCDIVRARFCLCEAGKITPATQATKQSDQEAKLFLPAMNCNKYYSALSSFTAHN